MGTISSHFWSHKKHQDLAPQLSAILRDTSDTQKKGSRQEAKSLYIYNLLPIIPFPYSYPEQL
jgi:hypothetical protein